MAEPGTRAAAATATNPDADALILTGLNPAQTAAVRHGDGPLLIVAGAGTGKTRTLVHRVAWAVHEGVDPGRILLLTFTRRAAAEMLRRVDELLRALGGSSGAASRRTWGGTFHAVAARLLRMHGKAVGLDPGFTIHDRGDSEDLMDVVRTELDLARTDKRFPKKGTCTAIYSHAVNSQKPLPLLLEQHYPWCAEYEKELKQLFRGYVDRKEKGAVLDYDDLLLFWHELLAADRAGDHVRARFDRVFVDEYQDTNKLQAELLRRLVPNGKGLTVVGDDAQSIYSFRAATVENILGFPKRFPGTEVVKLEQNYRSTQPILKATNKVIAAAKHRYKKDLWSERTGGERPTLVTCFDDDEQASYVARRILELRESGLELRQQAVLFRASHHSIALEAELARRKIPYVKYGGLKFVEAAHIKDLMAFLRLAENPADVVSGGRVLKLLPGIGPKKARDLMDALRQGGGKFPSWAKATVPPATRKLWPGFVKLLTKLGRGESEPEAQVHQARKFYGPLLEDKYDNAFARLRDLEQLEQVAKRFQDRKTMLVDLALDPPSSTEDLAGPPHLDEDFLILSTIHSAKGLEWDAVYVLHAADGNIPSDMAAGDVDQLDEERRLFYVALTRAKDWLYVCFPQRYYQGWRGGSGFQDEYNYAQLTRFITPGVKRLFTAETAGKSWTDDDDDGGDPEEVPSYRRARARSRSMWS